MDEVKVWEKELNQKWFPNSSFSKNEYVSLNISGLVAELFSLPLFLFKNLIFFSIYQRHSGQLSEEYVLMWWEMRMKEEICRHFCSLMGRHITIQRVGKPRVQSLPFNSEVLWVPLRLPSFNSTSEKQEGTLYVCQDPSRSNFFPPRGLSVLDHFISPLEETSIWQFSRENASFLQKKTYNIYLALRTHPLNGFMMLTVYSRTLMEETRWI